MDYAVFISWYNIINTLPPIIIEQQNKLFAVNYLLDKDDSDADPNYEPNKEKCKSSFYFDNFQTQLIWYNYWNST